MYSWLKLKKFYSSTTSFTVPQIKNFKEFPPEQEVWNVLLNMLLPKMDLLLPVEHTAAITSKLIRTYDKVFCRFRRAEFAYMNFLNFSLDITNVDGLKKE